MWNISVVLKIGINIEYNFTGEKLMVYEGRPAANKTLALLAEQSNHGLGVGRIYKVPTDNLPNLSFITEES